MFTVPIVCEEIPQNPIGRHGSPMSAIVHGVGLEVELTGVVRVVRREKILF